MFDETTGERCLCGDYARAQIEGPDRSALHVNGR